MTDRASPRLKSMFFFLRALRVLRSDIRFTFGCGFDALCRSWLTLFFFLSCPDSRARTSE
jgi:hypothetical protein